MTDLLWKELHRHALHEHKSGHYDMPWINAWSAKIPRFTTGCKCREHWTIWLRSNPPHFSTRGKYFAWTVKAHNAVNTRLKKPTLTVEEARKLYPA